jgi:hypothetical protein
VSNIIKFVSNRPWLNKESKSAPSPTSRTIPSWYREADRFAKMPNGDYWIGPDKGKIPTWKACPAVFDIMATGYVLKTPCDVEFYIDSKGKINVKIEDKNYQDFCVTREPMPQFKHPQGYHEQHFAWFPDWAVETPEGYSVLYTTPLNRYELPFLTTSGVIDNDKVNLPGSVPFFVIKGFEGVIEAGTPYAQMIPFKRDDWDSEVVIEKPFNLMRKNMENSAKYRKPDGGVYKNEVWTPRKYL